MQQRKRFDQISPITYQISVAKGRWFRRISDFVHPLPFAGEKSKDPLPCLIYRHASLIRRRLFNVDQILQENKAINLSLTAPKVNGLLIRPGEYFSFWRLVGNCTKKKGYREGLVINGDQPGKGVGGGMCQFTNLIHWMVLHTPLVITEHHHHHQVDLFPDFNRQLPFGTGTSIFYNYLDYRFYNPTKNTFQLLIHTTKEHLHGEIRALEPLPVKYHIREEGSCFTKEPEGIFRNNEIYREVNDVVTGKLLSRELIQKNHAKVLYPIELEGEQELK